MMLQQTPAFIHGPSGICAECPRDINPGAKSPHHKACAHSVWVGSSKNGRLGRLKHRNVLSHSSAGWESETKVSAGLVSSEASLLGLQAASFSTLCHGHLSVSVLVSSYRNSSHTGLGPTHWTSSYLDCLLKILSPNTAPF